MHNLAKKTGRLVHIHSGENIASKRQIGQGLHAPQSTIQRRLFAYGVQINSVATGYSTLLNSTTTIVDNQIMNYARKLAVGHQKYETIASLAQFALTKFGSGYSAIAQSTKEPGIKISGDGVESVFMTIAGRRNGTGPV